MRKYESLKLHLILRKKQKLSYRGTTAKLKNIQKDTLSTFRKAPPALEYAAMESLNIAGLPYQTATNCTTSTIAAETPAYFTTHANEGLPISIGRIDRKRAMTKTLYLWLLECRDNHYPGLRRLFTFYAHSKEEAERLVDECVTLQPHLVYVELHARPEGFLFFHFERPGQIEIEVQP